MEVKVAAKPPLAFEYILLAASAQPPFRAYDESIGWDLSANLISESGRELTWMIPPHATRKIPTGLKLKAPPGFYIQIASRSGLASKSIVVANAPGIIDPDYTGEIFILLFNGTPSPYGIKHGDRIAQAVLLPIPPSLPLRQVDDFPETVRGEKGFGSSGA